jgi:recombination protein RecA
MARRKKTENEVDNGSAFVLDDILDDPMYQTLTEESWSSVRWWCPTGAVSLDYGIGGFRGLKGGIPLGKAIEIFGPESSGKSALLRSIMANWTKLGGVVILRDAEDSHDATLLKEGGVDLSRLRILDFSDDKSKDALATNQVLSLEETFTKFDNALNKIREKNQDIPILLALDSMAACRTKEELSGKDPYEEFNSMKVNLGKASYLAQKFGFFCSRVTRNNATFISINQLRVSPNVQFADPHYTPGGETSKFHFSLRISLAKGKPIKADEDPLRNHRYRDSVGLMGEWKIIKNKLAPPMRTGKFPLYYDERSILHSQCLAQLIEDKLAWEWELGLERTGSWYSWRGERIGNGIKNLVIFFDEYPHIADEIEQTLFGGGSTEVPND